MLGYGLSKKRLAGAVGLISASVLLAGCTGTGQTAAAEQPDQSAEATVVRVIDGDTFVASIDGSEETVRLLNVDTPETKKPNVPIQCLGPEATEFLKERLPAGTSVRLEYDVERTDRYDRTLAGVFHDGDFVNADIARTGFGVAVLFEPNHRFYQEVLQAQGEAVERQAGLFSPVVECTIPGRVDAAIDELAALAPAAPKTAAEASGLLAGAATAIAAGKAAEKLLDVPGDASRSVHGAIRSALGGTLAPKLAGAMKKASKQENSLKHQRQSLGAKERKSAAQAKAKAEAVKRKIAAQAKARAEAAQREAAEQRAVAARLAAVRAAQERTAREAAQRVAAQKAAQEAARRQYTPPAPKVQTKKVPRKSGGSYPGYTGPRCYAPGGKSWKPCP